MHLEPLEGYCVVELVPTVARVSPLAVVGSRDDPCRQAAVLRGEGFARGDRVLIAYRQAVQVGDELLVPRGAILARLAA